MVAETKNVPIDAAQQRRLRVVTPHPADGIPSATPADSRDIQQKSEKGMYFMVFPNPYQKPETIQSNAPVDIPKQKIKNQSRADKVSASQKGVPETEKAKRNMSIAHGAAKIWILPFAARRWDTNSIMAVTLRTRKQVGDTIGKLRADPNVKVERPTKEEEREAKRKAHLGKPRNQEGKVYDPLEEESARFIRRMKIAEHVPDDLKYWNQLHQLFATVEIPLPESNFDKGLLEFIHIAATRINMKSANERKFVPYMGELVQSASSAFQEHFQALQTAYNTVVAADQDLYARDLELLGDLKKLRTSACIYEGSKRISKPLKQVEISARIGISIANFSHLEVDGVTALMKETVRRYTSRLIGWADPISGPSQEYLDEIKAQEQLIKGWRIAHPEKNLEYVNRYKEKQNGGLRKDTVTSQIRKSTPSLRERLIAKADARLDAREDALSVD